MCLSFLLRHNVVLGRLVLHVQGHNLVHYTIVHVHTLSNVCANVRNVTRISHLVAQELLSLWLLPLARDAQISLKHSAGFVKLLSVELLLVSVREVLVLGFVLE